ncbi:hypothetical protein PSACC_00830 [Paramicrosporidium saccamoebae]|uniref:Uncharacterized protein n=1 Tax=Paramicrosporidium saccamoebae TaxID=1246581 RepID=A0A2H9TNK0_9FUNG|nr:hypothetical protein PSACC_00830 [Paramicrosporidium saccamoebae]
MAIAKYSDFARTTTDFFTKDFPSGVVKVEARTQSRSLLASRSSGKWETFSDEFKVTASRDLATGAIAADSITTLTSSNLLTQQFIVTNAVLDGLKLDVTGTLQPNGTNSTKANVELNQGCFLTSTSIDVFRGPVLTTDLATRFRFLQLGGEVGYDVSKGTLDRYSVSLSIDRPREKMVLQALTGFKTFTASYFQKFNDQLEVAYRSSWNAKVPSLTMEVGAKWNLIGGGFIKAKLDNVGRLGLALASDLRPGVQMTLGATVDTQKLNDNAHKLGLELVYSA